MTKILESLGSEIKIDGTTIIIDSSKADKFIVKDEFTKKVRSSVFMLGPLLSRFKKAKVAYPGGCNIGNRPIDLHIKGLKCLNVKIEEIRGSTSHFEEQAAELGHSFLRELAFLTVHSMLHLLGYDHEEGKAEESEMFEKQEEILKKMHLARKAK